MFFTLFKYTPTNYPINDTDTLPSGDLSPFYCIYGSSRQCHDRAGCIVIRRLHLLVPQLSHRFKCPLKMRNQLLMDFVDICQRRGELNFSDDSLRSSSPVNPNARAKLLASVTLSTCDLVM